MPCNASYTRFIIFFFGGFSYVRQIDMQPIFTPTLENFILVKSGCYRYPGYKTLTIALEPSVELVAGVGRLTAGRIGTYIIPWGPPQDLEILFGGLRPP
jgi:hypothetical protein